MVERTHPPSQNPQMPVGEHFLEAHNVGITRVKPFADGRIAGSQTGAHDRDAPRVECRQGQLLARHLPTLSEHRAVIPPGRKKRRRRVPDGTPDGIA